MGKKLFTAGIILLVSLFWVSGSLFAQSCAFISETLDPDPRDVNLIDWLDDTYTVSVLLGDDLNSGVYFPEDFEAYDFVFVSETISSSDTEVLKGAPAPLFYTELWAAKVDITGWVSANSSPANYGSTGETEHTVKIVDGSHALAAGFATDAEVQIVSGADEDPGDGQIKCLTYCVPGIESDIVGVLTTNEERVVIMGVEVGTELFNDSGVMDGSVFALNRCATVGVFAYANDYITDNGKTLITAGINWILPVAIDEEPVVSPDNFSLEQNYPNPFNPTTKITFNLEKSAHTMLTVYDITGKEVARLIDNQMNQGEHNVVFNGSDLTSGVYFYQLISGDYQETKKMMLVK